MKCIFSLLFALAFASVVLSSVIKQTRPVRLQPGQTYLYEYSGRLLSGIPQLADQYAGFEIKADLILQPLGEDIVAMKLANVKVGKHNGRVSSNYQEDILMNHQPDALYQRELTKPIRFIHSDGKIKAFEADQSEPQWSLNIKKSILSLFNVNLTPKKILKTQRGNLMPKVQEGELTVYPIYEDGIGGVCETVYEINHIPDPKARQENRESAFVLNVTKTRNYDNCLTEPTIVNDNFDVRGCPSVCRKEKSFPAVQGYFPTPDALTDSYMSGCPCGKEPHESPVDSYNFVKYNISLASPSATIEQVYSEGKVSYKNNGDELLVIVQQNATLVKTGAVSGQISAIPSPVTHEELSFRLPKPQLPPGHKRPLDIPYYHLFGAPNVDELIQLVPQLLDSLASEIIVGDVAASKDSMPKTIQIVNALAVLPQQVLEQLYQKVAQQGKAQRATPKQQVVRKLFLDALPLAGSNQAAQYIKQLIEQNKVSTFEAKEMVEAVPQNMFLADIETIDQYLELFQNPKVQSRRHLAASTGIAFGKMVKEACVKRRYTPGDIPDDHEVPHQKRNLPAQLILQTADQQSPSRVTIQTNLPEGINSRSTTFSTRIKREVDQEWNDQFKQQVCSQADVQKYVQIIGRLIHQAKSFSKKITLIETLAHMGVPQALPILEPFVSGKISEQKCPGYPVEKNSQKSEECNFIRQVVIYALGHISEHYPKQVLPIVSPVYDDPTEPYEIRIAAFTSLIFADPEKQQLEKIASELHRENNRQVQSYVHSALQTVGNFSIPCFSSLSKKAEEAFKHAPDAEYGMQYSKLKGADYFDEKRDFGLYSVSAWTASNISQVPRSAYLAIGASNGPFQDELLQVEFKAKGVESLVERVMEPEGLLSDMLEGMHGKQKDRRISKRSADSAQQALQALKEKLDFEYRTDDEPKATIFFKLFDRTSYYALDKHYIHQLIDDAEDSLKDIAQSLLQGASYHYVKLLMPSQLYKVVPSELGLPIVISHRHPMILSLKVDNAKLSFETTPKTIYPTGVNVTAMIQPSFYYSSYSFMFAINPADHQSYGSHVEKTTQVSMPMEVSIGFVRPKNLFTFSYIPKVPQEIVYHKTQAKTFIAKANIAGAPERDWLQDSEPIKTMPVPFQWEENYGQEQLGLGVRVQVNSESAWNHKPFYQSETAQQQGLIPAAVEAFRNPGLEARELHVQLEADQEQPTYGYDVTLKYKWVSDEEQGKDSDDSDESSASGESDSDESDESSASKSSESKSSKSSSESESGSKSSKSSRSSEQSDESTSNSKKTKLQRKIQARLSKVINNKSHSDDSHKRNKRETNESSDESSNESGSQSFSKSGSKSSSQSSSSESASSEEKHKKHQHEPHHHGSQSRSSQSKSTSAQSSESSSSSSSQSDESTSMEDAVFDYDDVMQLILGQDFKKHNIRKIANKLIHKTRSAWAWTYDDDQDSSSEDSSEQDEDVVPATIAHDIAVTATARGPRPTYYAANVLYVHTYDHRTIWVKSDGHVKSPKGVYMNVPTLFCADAVVSYPALPGEFYYDPTAMQSAKAKIQAQAGWGEQCQNEGGVIITGVMEKTEDHVITSQDLAVQEGASPLDVQNWFHQQCQIDRSEGKPLSYACERAIIEDSYFNQLILDIQYKHLPKQFKNVTSKLDLALKVALYGHMDNDDYEVNNPEDQIRIVAQYSSRIPDVPMINLRIQKPHENTQFSKIHTPYVRPISSLLKTQQVYSNLVSGYDAQDTCNLMEDFVRTFDNVTYKLPANPCQYLLAKDCSPKERFAVFASHLDQQAKTKTVVIYAAGSEIKLTPPQQHNMAQVVIDGKVHELSFKSPITVQGAKNDVRVYLRKTISDAVQPIVVIELDNEQVEITYDGKNAKVQVGSQYQGKTCGLCGDNNDETEQEFQGPNQCIYESAKDFANSYALSGQHCASQPQPQGRKRCPAKVPESERQGLTHQKTIRIVRGPGGVTKLVTEKIVNQKSQKQRQQVLERQSNIEELQRKQQEQVERQQARQEGKPLSEFQQSTLFGSNPQQQEIIQRMRTQYIERDDMICFTTKPVLSCVQGRAQQMKQMQLDFHCLPKQSAFTQQLILDAATKVITQLANKRVDIRQTVQVPLSCVV